MAVWCFSARPPQLYWNLEDLHLIAKEPSLSLRMGEHPSVENGWYMHLFNKYNLCLTSVIIVFFMLGVYTYHQQIATPPNFIWALFSGYYSYDPRTQSPPTGLMLDRPETSLVYFFDANLKLCHGTYPPLSSAHVLYYEVEQVEYLGHTDYQAHSLVHTRIYFANHQSVLVVFQFVAGHNEGYTPIRQYFLLSTDISTVNAAAWISYEFPADSDIAPPGWSTYVYPTAPGVCSPRPPYRVLEWRTEPSEGR